MKIRPVKKIINAAITYNGEELAALDITSKKLINTLNNYSNYTSWDSLKLKRALSIKKVKNCSFNESY